MKHRTTNRVWLKAILTVIVSFFILAFQGMNNVDLTHAQSGGEQGSPSLNWDYQVDFNEETPGSVDQLAPELRTSLNGKEVANDLLALGDSKYRIVMSGDQGLDQLQGTLFAPQMPDFIGGVAELEINMPVGKLADLTIELDSNLTTGYRWELVSSQGVKFAQIGDSDFTPHSAALGASAKQTLVLRPSETGAGQVKLVYRRSFGPAKAATRRLRLNFDAQATQVDLSNPAPQSLERQDSPTGAEDNPIEDIPSRALPTALDWRTQGIVPAVRDQGSCGSCWAFGTVAVMESAVKKGGGPLADLSEQFLISCNKDGWSCSGGWTATKYHYNTLGKNQSAVGAVLESVKPYTETNGTCTVAYNHPYKASNWAFVTGSEYTMPTVTQIKDAIYTYGPITAGVCVDSGWNSYSGGVYNPTSNACGGYTNHQIVLVGWDDATSSWILRNSWGPSWGENGYMRIKWDTTGTTSRVGEGTSWVKYVGLVPSPIAPSGTVTDNTPTYAWSRVTNATQYQYQLYKGTALVYTKNAASTSSCGPTTCYDVPTNTLGEAAYKWRVRALVGGAWKSWSAWKNFTVATSQVPTPKTPAGTISDTTPTYTWTKINNAWLYQYQVLQGSTFRLIKWTNASVCSGTTCSVTPPATLAYTGHSWRVRARVGSEWSDWSPWKAFTVMNGFNSQFNGGSPGWIKHPGGTWYNSSTTYYTNGVGSSYTSSTSYNQDFSNFTYQARVKTSNASVDSVGGLVVRGTPTFDSYNDWENGYYFLISDYGDFEVLRIVSGSWYLLQSWTISPSIAANDWNTLKVVTSGSVLKFYINGNLVWSGMDATYSSGRVGVLTWSYPSAERMDIAWATLDSGVAAVRSASADEQIEAGQSPSPFDHPNRHEIEPVP
jgi:predicted secreted protein